MTDGNGVSLEEQGTQRSVASHTSIRLLQLASDENLLEGGSPQAEMNQD